MLVATYASAALICLASLLVGRAILYALGRRETAFLEPAVGLATLLVAGSLAARLPGRATTTLVVIVLLLVGALAYLRGRALPSGSLRLALPVALLTLLVASIPFIASGNLSVLGIGVNNDLAGHLHYAAWLEDPIGITPTEIKNGYPMGPHGLVAAIAKGIGAEPLSAMLGLLLAVPVLTAISALSVLRDLSPLPRAIAATITALPYLAASTLAIGGFKETIMALLLIGFVLGLRELSEGEGGRRGVLVALVVLAAGMLAVYSYPGVLYAALVAGFWGAAELIAAYRRGEGDQVSGAIRSAGPLLVVPLLLITVIALIQLPQAIDFVRSGAVGYVQDVNSRLKEAVSPLEALGAWPAGDFLEGTAGLDAYLIFGVLGALALLVGIALAIRDNEKALLAGLVGAILIYLGTLIDGGFYVQAKALAIASPLGMLIALRGLLAASDPRASRASTPAAGEGSSEAAAAAPVNPKDFVGQMTRPPRTPITLARTLLAVAFIGIAAYSSFLALRDARVAPPEFASEQLGQFRDQVRGKRVLSLTSDRYTDYWLRGAELEGPARFSEEQVLPRNGKLERLPVDFDSVAPTALDRFDYAVTTKAAYKSAPPSSYELADETESFQLWKRTGKSPLTGVLPEEERPGSRYNCKITKLLDLVAAARGKGYDTARVQPRSIVGKRLLWSPASKISNGNEISQTMELPKGLWQLSLQYYSPVLELEVEAGEVQTTLPPTADGGVRFRTAQGPFWALGEVNHPGGPLEVTIRAGGLSGLQELLGVDQVADIGNVTAAQPDAAREIPLVAACGQYVDHYTVGPG